jgi:hypothetical protein
MKIDKELELKFIRAIQKRASDRTNWDEVSIRKRNRYIDDEFEITPHIFEKIKLLNEKLRQEEKVYWQYQKIEENCKLMVKNKEIQDFKISLELSLFNNKHYKKFDPEVYGNSFFQTSCDFMLMKKEEVNYNAEWDIIRYRKSPFEGFEEISHCNSFHSLYDHCHELTWFDIYNIDEFWMEIKVDYQFFRKVN